MDCCTKLLPRLCPVAPLQALPSLGQPALFPSPLSRCEHRSSPPARVLCASCKTTTRPVNGAHPIPARQPSCPARETAPAIAAAPESALIPGVHTHPARAATLAPSGLSCPSCNGKDRRRSRPGSYPPPASLPLPVDDPSAQSSYRKSSASECHKKRICIILS